VTDNQTHFDCISLFA